MTTLPTLITPLPSTTSTDAISTPAPRELSIAAYTGIGVGSGITFLLIILGVMLCVRRQRNNASNSSNQKELLNRRRRSPTFELSGGLDGIAQLETRERLLELPVGRNNNPRYM